MTFDTFPLHFLRPDWLWALFALPLLAWLAHRRAQRDEPWRDAIDAHLLPHLLDAPAGRRRRFGLVAAALGYSLAVVALAGPAWRQVEQPLAQGGTPLVIALDLSSETLAADLPPSRLAQARAKLAQLLRMRDAAPVALVVYADDAFTVAPLTGDAANVALFLDALAPDVMPVDGRRADRAIAWAAELLRRAGHARGRILLLTGDAEPAAREAAAEAASAGYRVSVLGLGTPAGAQVLARDGSIRPVRLQPDALRAVARAGDGEYAPLQPDDGDLRALGLLDATADPQKRTGATRRWKDDGYWLLPPLMLLALFAFRRRAGVAALLLCACLPWPTAEAAGPQPSGSWWQRPDQAAHARLQEGNDAYRRGDFDAAAALYRGLDSADAHYNRGNALAKAGEYERAIEAYDEALQRRPGMPDALANRRAVAAAMQRQSPSGPKDEPQGRGGDTGDQGKPGGKGEAGSEAPPRPDQPTEESSKPRQQKPQSAQSKSDATERERQQQADAAQRQRMQRALQEQGGEQQKQDTREARPDETPAQRERRIANEAWLRRVPDDPGGLLRAKFRLEHERRQQEGEVP